jgi:SAM-dependent methyltransferase
MASAERSVRALSFGAIAEEYRRFRPGPPAAAVEWIVPERCDTAVDIGAGTGALTAHLVRHAPRVIAVEPDRRMSAVLGSLVTDAVVTTGRAEQLPLRDGTVDVVAGASMWHWVDEERAATEVARVLRPGGVLGLLWSGPDRTEGWLANLLTASRGEAPVNELAARSRQRRQRVNLPAHLPFAEPETQVLRWSLSVTPEQIIGLARTYSGFIVLPEAERERLQQLLVDAVRDHPVLAGQEQIDLPMRCTAWRAVRLG